jgi:hypothetical protein
MSLLISACEKEVEVTKIVTQKETVIETVIETVTETIIQAGEEVVVTREVVTEVEVEVVVTVTPEPAPEKEEAPKVQGVLPRSETLIVDILTGRVGSPSNFNEWVGWKWRDRGMQNLANEPLWSVDFATGEIVNGLAAGTPFTIVTLQVWRFLSVRASRGMMVRRSRLLTWSLRLRRSWRTTVSTLTRSLPATLRPYPLPTTILWCLS